MNVTVPVVSINNDDRIISLKNLQSAIGSQTDTLIIRTLPNSEDKINFLYSGGNPPYLEAEAAGIRGTGIGCYFDDSVHEILGIKDDKFQSLYHFTVGEPLEDKRLETLPAYGHLSE